MLSNKGIKDIQSLRDKKSRDAAGLFVAEGPKIVSELMAAAPDHVAAVYGLEHWVRENEKNGKGAPVETVDERLLQRISHLQTPNTVVAVFRFFATKEPSAKNEFCIYLDAVQDPGNLGTIIRLADWFAVPHVVCSPGCADVYNPKVVQSTMASLARVNVWYDKREDWLAGQDAPILAAALNGKSLYSMPPAKAGVLMIGNESKGLRPEYLQRATEKVTIPRRGSAESLNAAVATGILLSHLVERE